MFNFLIGLIIGVGVGWVVWKKKGMDSGPAAGMTGKGGGETNPNAEKIEEKRENLEKVLAMAAEKGEIANDDVEHVLGVSNATAERYLNELEEQGKLTQVGETGQSVRYRLK